MSTDDKIPTPEEEPTTEAAETASTTEDAPEAAEGSTTDEAVEAASEDVSAAEVSEETASAPAEPTQEPAATIEEAAPSPAEPAPEAAPVKASAASQGKQGPAWGQIALFGGGAIAILVLLFIWISGGSAAGDVIKRMPASASGVAAMDLSVLTDDPNFAKLADIGTQMMGAEAKEFLEVMPLTSLKTVGVALDDTMKKGAFALSGDFEAAKVASLLADKGKLTEGDIEGKKAWSIDGPGGEAMAIAVFDNGTLVFGHKAMVSETVKSLSGEGKTVGDNEALSTALGHIDSGATLVMAADNINTNTNNSYPGEEAPAGPVITFGLSVNLDSTLAFKVFVKGENELAKTQLNQGRMGFEMAKGMAPQAIDAALTDVPAEMKGMVEPWSNFAKEFVASLEVSDVDGGVVISASATLPEGGIFEAAAQALPLFL